MLRWVFAVTLLALAFPGSPAGGQGAAAPAAPEAGVSARLAEQRARRILDLRYNLSFSIPSERNAPIAGRAAIAFRLTDTSDPLIIDFNPNRANAVHAIEANGRAIDARHLNEHLVVPAAALHAGSNVVTIDFDAG